MVNNPDLQALHRELGELHRRVGRLEGEVHVLLILVGATLAGVVGLVVKFV